MKKMSVVNSITQKTFRRNVMVFFILSSTLPLLILLFGIFQYVLPQLSADQAYALRGVFSIGLLAMLFLPGLGFLLIFRWVTSFEALGKEIKEKASQVLIESGGMALVDTENEAMQLQQTFTALFNDFQNKAQQLKVYSKKLIHSHEKLSELAIKDELTGLYNRRYFNMRIEDEGNRVDRFGHALALILIDLDCFKQYNDTYGHPTGDMLLQDLGGLFAKSIRKIDMAFRYGGDEFAVLLPGCDVQMARKVAEKLAGIVADHVFTDTSGADIGRIAVTCGVAGYTKGMDVLVADADKDLYKSKNVDNAKRP